MKCVGLRSDVRILLRNGGGTVRGTVAILLHLDTYKAGAGRRWTAGIQTVPLHRVPIQNLLWKEGQS